LKLAELLIGRKAEKNNLAFLEGRLKANAKVQEGEKPQEDPAEILAAIVVSLQKIEILTRKINASNERTAWGTEEFVTLADALARRDLVSKHRRILTAALDAITVKEPRFGRMEIKYIPMLDTAFILSQIDMVTKAYAELETKIQQRNWTTEV
jgi:hypothetical protein